MDDEKFKKLVLKILLILVQGILGETHLGKASKKTLDETRSHLKELESEYKDYGW